MDLLFLYDIFGSATTRINLFVQLIDLLGTFTVYSCSKMCQLNLFLFQGLRQNYTFSNVWNKVGLEGIYPGSI